MTAVGVVLSLAGLGQAIASPLWGYAVPRLGYLRLITATSAFSCAALLIAGASRSLPLLAAGLLVNAVCAAALLTAAMSVMAAAVSPERRGAVLGQIRFAFYLGGLIGPLIGVAAFQVGQMAVFGVAGALSLAAPAILLATVPAHAETPVG